MGTLYAQKPRSVNFSIMGTLHAQKIEKCKEFWITLLSVYGEDTADTLRYLSTFVQFSSQIVLLLSLISH